MTEIPKGEDREDPEVRWQYASFTSRFVFARTLELNPETMKKLLRTFISDLDIRKAEIGTETSGISKYIILDVRVILPDGKEILVEMQVSKENGFVYRIRLELDTDGY